MRRIATIVLATGMMVLSIHGANPAAAVDATATCDQVRTPVPALKPQNGSYVVQASTGCQRVQWTYGAGFSSGVTVSVGGTNVPVGTGVTFVQPATITVTSTGPSVLINLIVDANASGSTANGQTYNITFFTPGGGGGGGSGSGTSSVPAPIVQQFGLPASGTCDAAATASLNWAGVASGGWSISWGEWMNGGRGGAVCTRTLVYSTRAGAWSVAS